MPKQQRLKMPRLRRRQRDLLLAASLGLTAACAGLLLSRALPQGASVVLGGQTRGDDTTSAIRVRSEAPPTAPSVTAAAPALRPRLVQPVTGVRAERPPEIPAAPPLVASPQSPRVTVPSVVAVPGVTTPSVPASPVTAVPQTPAEPPVASVVAAPQAPPVEASVPVTAAPQRPPQVGTAVTSAPGWMEVPIQQREPRIRVYNRTADGGRSRLLLRNGSVRRGFPIKHPYGQLDVLPGEYHYELYFAGSALAPLPDQVGVLRCRSHRMYYFHLFTQPASATIREDLGDR